MVKKSDGFQKGLTSEDVLALSSEDDARRNAERLQRFWDEELETCKLANDSKEEADKVQPSLPKVHRFYLVTLLHIQLLVFLLSL